MFVFYVHLFQFIFSYLVILSFFYSLHLNVHSENQIHIPTNNMMKWLMVTGHFQNIALFSLKFLFLAEKPKSFREADVFAKSKSATDPIPETWIAIQSSTIGSVAPVAISIAVIESPQSWPSNDCWRSLDNCQGRLNNCSSDFRYLAIHAGRGDGRSSYFGRRRSEGLRRILSFSLHNCWSQLFTWLMVWSRTTLFA